MPKERPKRRQESPKGGPREAKGKPKGGQGRRREAKEGQGRQREAKIQKDTIFVGDFRPLFGGPGPQKASQSQKSDFSKMSVSPKRRAHFQRAGQAKPGQKGLAKPGQAREGLSGPSGEARAVSTSRFWEGGVFTRPSAGGFVLGWSHFGAPEPFQERFKNQCLFT